MTRRRGIWPWARAKDLLVEFAVRAPVARQQEPHPGLEVHLDLLLGPLLSSWGGVTARAGLPGEGVVRAEGGRASPEKEPHEHEDQERGKDEDGDAYSRRHALSGEESS